VDAIQDAARQAIDLTRALIDVAEALVNDPEVAQRLESVVRTVSETASRTTQATQSPRSSWPRPAPGQDPDDGDGVQSIPVT